MPKLQRQIGAGMLMTQRWVMLWRLTKFHTDRFVSFFLDANRMGVDGHDMAIESLREMTEALDKCTCQPTPDILPHISRGLRIGRATAEHVEKLFSQLDEMAAKYDD